MPRLISHPHVASPITQTPGRSESARLSAARGACCRFVMRSAGSLGSRIVKTGWALPGGILTAAGLCSWRCSFVSGCQMRTGASLTCAPVRKASDGMLRAHSRLPLFSATSAHFCISRNRPRAVADRRRRRYGDWQPTSVTTLGGISVGDGRVAAGASELGSAMSAPCQDLRVMAGASAAPDGQPVRSRGAGPVTASAAPGSADCNSP